MDPSETSGTFYYQEETKLYCGIAMLAILDSPFLLYKNVKLNTHNPTVIKGVNRNRIGHANVFLQNNKIMADIAIDYHTPERLDIENKTGLYLHSFGFIKTGPTFNIQHIDFYGKMREVFEISIFSLGFSYKHLEDLRILPVGELILV